MYRILYTPLAREKDLEQYLCLDCNNDIMSEMPAVEKLEDYSKEVRYHGMVDNENFLDDSKRDNYRIICSKHFGVEPEAVRMGLFKIISSKFIASGMS